MNTALDDRSGIPVLFRPLFVELSEPQIAAVDEAQADADEEAFVTSVVERVRREGEVSDLERQLVLLRAWAVKKELLVTAGPSLQVWLRVLERDAELHRTPKWTGDLAGVDLFPAMYFRKSDLKTPVWDILTRPCA